jgi:hypothetical protein
LQNHYNSNQTTSNNAQSRKVTPQGIALKDAATGIFFSSNLDDKLILTGVGVRKKSILNIYAVAVYSSSSAVETLIPFTKGKQQRKEALAALRNAARTFGPSTCTTSFVLQMVYKVDAKTIAGAIAESIKPRYVG